jgi:FMN phosphatase YigB (HAD superfamily)
MLARGRAILFDVDGVLVRNRAVSAAIEKRVVNYVHTRANVPLDCASRVNRELYSAYGHTHTGLKAAYRIKDTIHDFNTFVYDDKTILECYRELVSSSEACDGARALFTELRGAPVFLFTNAPDVWADAVVQALGLNIRMERRLTSSSFGLKPDDATYARVAAYAKADAGVETLVFVDDQLRNLVPVLNMPDWQPVLYAPDSPELHIGRAKVVNTLAALT